MAVYLTLTILVWGLTAFHRGPWQDEMSVINYVQIRSDNLLSQLFTPIVTPTRVLAGIPFVLAAWSGDLVVTLQLIYGLSWLSSGLLTAALVRRVFPNRDLIAYVSGGLALSATGDFAFNYLGATSLLMSVVFFLVALFSVVSWWQDPTLGWALLGAGSLLASVWMYDAALAAILLTPVFLWFLDGFRLSRRLLGIAMAWYGLILPYLFLFARFLLDPTSYAQSALVRMRAGEWIVRVLNLFLYNFTPWVWALDRPQWFPAPPRTFTDGSRLALSMGGVLVFLLVGLWWFAHSGEHAKGPIGSPKSLLAFSAVCLLMAAASNASYASVHVSDLYFRTQLMSQVWTSMAIATLSYLAAGWFVRRPRLALVIPALFVGFGIAGGLERQDYYLSYWRLHRIELQSIVEQIPALRPEAEVILYVPSASPYRATTAESMARAWLSFLLEDPFLSERVFLWSQDRGTTCRAMADSFVCTVEPDVCLIWPSCRPVRVPFSRAVLLTYSVESNRYLLQTELPAGWLNQAGVDTTAYHPRAQILEIPPTLTAFRTIYGH